MSLIQCGYRKSIAVAGVVIATMLLAETALAKDYSSMSISDVLASAELAMQRVEYKDAIPALQEVISRTSSLTDSQGRQTAQSCRYELARVYFQTGDYASGMPLLDDYLNNEPRPMEKTAIRMLAQGFFDSQDWDKIVELSARLLAYDDLNREDRFNVNLLVGQDAPNLNDLIVQLASLKEAADSSSSEFIVNILPDDRALHGRIVQVMDACAAAKVKNMSFSTASI